MIRKVTARAGTAVLALAASFLTATVEAAPLITRFTPPSALFTFGDPNPPYIARFLPGQRFDIQVTIQPDAGQTISAVRFEVDGKPLPGAVSFAPATAPGLPAGTVLATLRAYSNHSVGAHVITARVTQADGQRAMRTANFETVAINTTGRKVKNVIVMIGDGMGSTHRTAARIVANGVMMGKANAPLAMDTFTHTAMIMTASLNSIITDSSPGAACYASGNKANNNQQNVFPDDTVDAFDNPRVEHIGEYLSRTQGKALGIVTTADVFDATPASFASHTSNRGAGTGICDQFLDESSRTNLRVLLGGGRKWFLPNGTPGSARSNGSDYVLPAELATGWNVPAGTLDPSRDLLADFATAGFAYAPDSTDLQLKANTATKLLGLFSLSNMNVAYDKINGRRGTSTVVNDFGFPNQPMLDEMTGAALKVLNRNANGFVLMVEGASIDKQAHNMDTERWILDTIEFDNAIGVAKDFAASRKDTLVIVTADHECGGATIIGASRVTNADLTTRAASGQGAAALRNGVVGTYETAGFPEYLPDMDGYPVSMDVDFRLLVGYGANGDRYEDWLANTLPINDSQQPFNNAVPLNTYPQISPTGTGRPVRDQAGQFLITGQVADSSAVHSGSDIPLSAFGHGAALFGGTMDNTDVFFRMMQGVLGGSR